MLCRPKFDRDKRLAAPRAKYRTVADRMATPSATAGLMEFGIAGVVAAALTCGCTGPLEYIRNGFKVGPNYCPPAAAVADNWIDAADKRVHSDTENLGLWWRVFNDGQLESLIREAYEQNLTLKEAGF